MKSINIIDTSQQKIFRLSPENSYDCFSTGFNHTHSGIKQKENISNNKIKINETTNRTGEQYLKVDFQQKDLIKKNHQSKNEIKDDNNVSEFVRKFRIIPWYKFIYLVSEAVQRWKRTLNTIRIQNATQNQLDMINDKCFYESDWNRQLRIEQKQSRSKTADYQQSKFMRIFMFQTRFIRIYYREIYLKLYEYKQYLLSVIVNVLDKVPIFDPLDKIVLVWEIFYFIFCMFLFVYLPYSVAFEKEMTLIIRGDGHVFTIVFLAIDILKNLNTAIYVKGELIKEHLSIFQEQMRSLELPLDILTYFTAICVIQFNYSRSLFLLRIFYKPNLIQKFKDAFQMSEKSIAVFDLLKLFATVLYLCHVVACVWYKIGEIEVGDGEGWIVTYQYQNSSFYTLYVNSYFFSIIMMSSVKGNIQPITNSEKIFTSLMAFGACVLFGYTITSITIILRNLITKEDNFNLKISQISKIMLRYNVDTSYQSRARKYVEYVKESSIEEKRKSQSVLNCLSKQLQNDIFINIYSQVNIKFNYKNLLVQQYEGKIFLKIQEKKTIYPYMNYFEYYILEEWLRKIERYFLNINFLCLIWILILKNLFFQAYKQELNQLIIFLLIQQQSLVKLPFFKNNFSQQCIDQLALKMQSAFYACDDVIVDRALHSEPALYFIIEGEVIEYYYPNSEVYNSENAITIREKKRV